MSGLNYTTIDIFCCIFFSSLDINECEIPGMCSQLCYNTKGGFKCSCMDGYRLDPNGRKCRAEGKCEKASDVVQLVNNSLPKIVAKILGTLPENSTTDPHFNNGKSINDR